MKKIILSSTFCMLLITNIVSTPKIIKANETEQLSKIEESISDNGITFTINRYEKKDGKLTIYYTVTSENSVLKENKIGYQFMDRPHFYINQKYLNVGYRENQTKINDNKLTGFVSIDLNDIRQEQYNFTIMSDRIADKVGNWKISFDVK